MKVNLNSEISSKNTGFTGFYKQKNDDGKNELKFFYPFDDINYDCYIEFRDAILDDDKHAKAGDEPLKDLSTDKDALQIHYGPNKVNITSHFGLKKDEPFAYRFKLVSKNNPSDVSYRTDAGLVIKAINGGENDQFNIMYPNDMRLKKGGAMKLVIPDSYNPAWVYDRDNEPKKIGNVALLKVQESNKTFSNKIGGSLAGIERDLDDGRFDSFSRIISTPIGTDDSLTSHAYWSKNNMQMALSLGNINNFQSLMRKMFIKDKNFVFDAALTNEGIEGIHFADVLKRGKDSPFYHWFNVEGFDLAPLKPGVFSAKKDVISYRFVNSKNDYYQDETGQIHSPASRNYDKYAPTYIQIFDKRFVKNKFTKEDKLIQSYDKLSLPNKLEVNNSNDTVVPNSFMVVDENVVKRHIDEINKLNKELPADKKIKLDSYNALRLIAQFENYSLEDRNIESGFYTWDANPDILKLRYMSSTADDWKMLNVPKNERAYKKAIDNRYSCEAKDYAITSGIYWSEKTRDTLITYIAQQLKGVDPNKPDEAYALIMDKVNERRNGKPNPQLPLSLRDSLTENMVRNVMDDTYIGNHINSKKNYDEMVLSSIMNFPLDTVELGDDIVAAFSSHFMSKRASSPEQIGKTKYEMYEMGNPHLKDDNKDLYLKTQKIYENELGDFTKEILAKVNSEMSNNMQLYDKKNGCTPLGQEVLPLISKEIAKFAIIKSLVPNAEYWYDSKTGELSYKYDELKNVHMQDLGINTISVENEVADLTTKIRSGIKHIGQSDKDKLARAIRLSIKDTTPKSYELARLIVDKTGAGLDWRIDAAKDVADIDALRNGEVSFDETWNGVTDFWANFSKNIHKVNPNAYMAAEITDENTLYNIGNGKNSSYNRNEIVPKFLNKTEMTTIANYSYFFSTIAKMFGPATERDGELTFDKQKSIDAIYDKLTHNESYDVPNPYLKSAQLESLLYSYNFISNHDKPRMLHCLAMDMSLFFGDLSNPSNTAIREKAYKLTHNKLMDGNVDINEVNSTDFSHTSPKACAMGWALNSGFGNAIATMYPNNPEKASEVYSAIAESLCDLTNGKYKDHYFEADGFGVKDFTATIPLVIDQAKYAHNLVLTRDDEKALKNQTFEFIMDRGISKLLGMMKVLVALPGIPTLFSGDDLASSGFEEKTKNIYQQNRNANHYEWIDEKNIYKYKEFVAKHYKEFDDIMGLRNDPRMHSLNDGTPYVLRQQSGITGILRQSPNGDMAVSLMNLNNIKNDDGSVISPENYYNPAKAPITVDKIYLGGYGDARQGSEDFKAGLSAGLPDGTVFRSADKENAKYVVRYFDDTGYVLIKLDSFEKPVPITISDTTLNLYHLEPKPAKPNASQPAFGSKKTMYNPQYHFISLNNNVYNNKKVDYVGSKLILTSK
ncbi:MAG: hypothetical protein LKG27_04270 [Clostridiaceae bacterium]|jgi:hypothetical protein|nr:hypothetical protein [Clostridiaceae bacterium]